jgi:hypothetical protein
MQHPMNRGWFKFEHTAPRGQKLTMLEAINETVPGVDLSKMEIDGFKQKGQTVTWFMRKKQPD